MPESVDALQLQFLAWVSTAHRTYADAMAAWQSTCPRHTVWEDALMEGLIEVESNGRQAEARVTLTPKGRAILDDSNHKAKPAGSRH